jgi:hypothetical protein
MKFIIDLDANDMKALDLMRISEIKKAIRAARPATIAGWVDDHGASMLATCKGKAVELYAVEGK